jgi:hypothetical protein
LENHHQFSDENDGGGFNIKNITSIVLAVVGVAGLITTYFLSIADFKVKDTEIATRVAVIERNIGDLQKALVEIDKGGTRGLYGLQVVLQETKKEVEELKILLRDTRESLIVHDEKLPQRRRNGN